MRSTGQEAAVGVVDPLSAVRSSFQRMCRMPSRQPSRKNSSGERPAAPCLRMIDCGCGCRRRRQSTERPAVATTHAIGADFGSCRSRGCPGLRLRHRFAGSGASRASADAARAGDASAKHLRVAVHALDAPAQEDQVVDMGSGVAPERLRAVRSLLWPMRRLLLHAGHTRATEQTTQSNLASAATHARSTPPQETMSEAGSVAKCTGACCLSTSRCGTVPYGSGAARYGTSTVQPCAGLVARSRRALVARGAFVRERCAADRMGRSQGRVDCS